MTTKLLQFNSDNSVIDDKNVIESLVCDYDLVFNESYIVIGPTLEGKHIHATYDLIVLGDVFCDKLTVNGDLLVYGDIEANEVLCHGNFICTGEVRVEELVLEAYSIAGSIVGKRLYAGGDLFLQATVDTGIEFEADGLVVAGEGIMGDGVFKAKAAIANEYFEFNGDCKSKVFEITGMDFTNLGAEDLNLPISQDENMDDQSMDEEVSEYMDIEATTSLFNKALKESIYDWSELEEDAFIEKIRNVVKKIDNLHLVNKLLDRITALSYDREIENFRDYLFVLCAKNVFPTGISEYDTIEPVLVGMFNKAQFTIDTMEYRATNIEEFAFSLYIINRYQDEMPIGVEEAADKIFSSVGIRYSTVEQIWREFNG